LKNIEHYIKNDELYAVIRGDACVYHTPPEVNAQRLPTDHCVMLEKGIYLAEKNISLDYLTTILEAGIKASCSDALGYFCAVQCFYSQVVNEEFGCPITIDKKELPIYLGNQLFVFQTALKSHTLFGKDKIGMVWEYTQTYIKILQRDYNIDFGIK
jgi:hypothetical protein